ncbi:MAG: hypothetical protein NTW40_02615, partial [Acidobacteria bacterium]|nr:hypothetical protein [Acidobacteriota bacterium]
FMQYLLGHLAVRIHRDDQGACFYPSALAVFIDRAAWMTVPRRAAASFDSGLKNRSVSVAFFP